MALTQTVAHPSMIGAGLAAIGKGVLTLADMFDMVALAHTRGIAAQRLMDLSDEQLAKRGLKRTDIVNHIYG